MISQLESNEQLGVLLRKIKKIEIQLDFFNKTNEELTDDDTRILLESANLLASSSKIENQRIALNIATTLPLISDSSGVSMASLLILRKLGNYPGMKLLEKRNEMNNYKTQLSGMAFFEAHVLEYANTRKLSGKEYLLTNFQKKVVDMLEKDIDGISISAPTSAGKSYVFLKVLLDLISKDEGSTVVYIVPTRALIKQVMSDFLENIAELGLRNLYVGCSSEIEVIVENPDRSNILVLTQERLYQLCNKQDAKKVKTKMIVIDEAHNIQYGGRGVLLENAIKFAHVLWEDAKVLFSSPLVKNPQKLLDTFDLERGLDEKDDFPLVRQNIIKVKMAYEQLLVSALYEEDEISIGSKFFHNSGNTLPEILANTALYLWNNQTSIIYANEPMMSADVIRELFNSGEFPYLNDARLDEFADFIEEYITKNYELASFIRCGLAFHFGALPAIIRSGIEELFKAGALKIVSCTSTLLEGVNMPAKNIFVYKPEKGQHKAIDNLSFWNLAGRAGRIGNDFAGNIICIELDSWASNPISGERYQEILPSSELRLIKDSVKFKEFIESQNPRPGKDDYNEQLFSLIIKERLLGRNLESSTYSKEHNINTLKEIDIITRTTIDTFKPPKELLNKNPGIMPERINALWEFLDKNKGVYHLFLPAFPLSENGYERFYLIIQIINNLFMGAAWSELFEKKITTAGHNWMKGTSLAQLVFFNRAVLSKGHREITKHVKDQIEFINNTLRYQIVKYTQTYVEVLKIFLQSIGKVEESEKVINISAYLEYGACTASALEFMAIGLPREAAIKLAEIIGNHENINTDYCIEWLKRLDVNSLDIANYLKKQINGLQITL
ncbi:DEAD/DEAH box helicase [Paenibacillus sp. MAH-36]|uniref:DEAD/DEAH box helicase n=1 Tax=Paenibacillus violae TaxID=3077234 RepID=A0ABU3RPB9_9BACL|nr:DEAD/DEAH box helicase [Paenibacillus sp. PFR10]MDU0205824.1 DEAD/DEAH box helicase [Paenibacillus sp. PFR10]